MKAIFKRFLRESDFSKRFSQIGVQLSICTLIVFVLLHLSYSLTLFEYPYDYEKADVVSADIVLSEDYIDTQATQLLKDNVQYEVDAIYTLDPKVYAEAKTSISNFYNQAYDIRSEYPELEIRLRVFTYLLKDSFELTQEDLTILGSIEDVELRLTENYIYDVLKVTYESGITDENIISRQQGALSYFDSIEQISEEVKPILRKIVVANILENSYLDETATAALIEEEQALISDVVIPTGTVLVKAGETLDEKSYGIINELNLNDLHTFEQNVPLLSMDGIVLLVLILMNITLRFYYKSRPTSNKYVYMNHIIMMLTFFMTFGLRNVSLYMIPLATSGMLISILDEYATGIIYSFFASLLFGIIFNLPITIIGITVLGAMIASMMVYKVYQRGRIFTTGLIVSLLNALVVFGHVFINDIPWTLGTEYILFSVLAGIICSVVTIGSLPLWENIFRVLTPLKLLELSNPNHPLMKKMLLEAPGTYHHSIMVANLSEAAVHDIDGNAILARVGAYFHDVGKLEKPYFFVENQFENNPHDQLVPHVSAKIIKEHIGAGLALGKKYKLPNEIMSFIEEHHGTTMIRYFYHKACENNESEDDIEPLAYTYEGPIPSSRETAIVMLADSVEAAVRSMKQGDVKTLISKIIDDKIKSHQLDNSKLTFGDIEVIKQSFYSNLSSAFHERIEYPEMIEQKINVIK